jgi:hypothetical protein
MSLDLAVISLYAYPVKSLLQEDQKSIGIILEGVLAEEGTKHGRKTIYTRTTDKVLFIQSNRLSHQYGALPYFLAGGKFGLHRSNHPRLCCIHAFYGLLIASPRFFH